MIEALLAVSLVAVAVAGAAKLVVAARQLADAATDKHKAARLVINQIERMDMSNFKDIDMWAVDKQVVDENGTPSLDGRFRLTTTVTNTETNLKQVVIQVDTQSRKTLDFGSAGQEISFFISDI